MTTGTDDRLTQPHLTPQRAALEMLAAWMGERFFRTFRFSEGDPAPFDAVLAQRERRIGVSVGLLWDEPPAEVTGDVEALPGAAELGELLTDDLDAWDEGGYVVWVPPQAQLPTDEPARSDFRISLGRGLRGLQPGERREVRLPVTLKLAKINADGAYVSVSGTLASQWTTISEGVQGAYHLDARALHRLPEESAEVDIIVSRVRDRAALLNTEELTDVRVHDYWLVSRLPAGAPRGVLVVGAPPELDPQDGTASRRAFRRSVQRAVEQRRAGDCELSVLVVMGALRHIGDELVTAGLRGMNPATYGALDLVALVADGQVRQVLQPRTLPWEQPR
ncbi:MAG: hypothetical protein GEU80_03840 [Dehalococcoidia bacterium]|nr:hypothetical protein [Dehalococcoidia bacterium]